jgi:hypothetical protein
MKSLFLIFSILFFTFIQAQKIDSLEISSSKLYYHYTKSDAQNDNLFIFLHGKVKNFNEKNPNRLIPIDSLLEGNLELLSTLKENKFDVLLPQSYNEANWINEKGADFVSTLYEKYSKNYKKIVIGGFSDGGTGAYRIFYTNPEKFEALVMFNAYPQMDYFNKKVDYFKVTNKEVFFISQKNDNLVPYEFMLMEYRRQKMVNTETYFILRNGKHEFSKYVKNDFELIVKKILNPVKPNESKEGYYWIHAPIDGLVFNTEINELYDFRKSYSKQYNIDIKEYMSQVEAKKTLSGILKKYPYVKAMPLLFSKEELEKKDLIEFQFISNNATYTIYYDNYFKIPSW